MRPVDREQLQNGDFDRDQWASLWDRINPRLRKKTIEFVLHQLHAVESGGRYSCHFFYRTNAEREDKGEDAVVNEQPGDIIEFEATFQFGSR